MRTIFILGLLAGIAFLAGWFTVDRDTDSTTIQIDRNEIRADAQKAIERGQEFLDRRQQSPMESTTPDELQSPWGPAPAWEEANNADSNLR